MKKGFTRTEIFNKFYLKLLFSKMRFFSLKNRFKNVKFLGGFTLIELLVVIAIIGILSSVIISSLSKARTKSRVESVQSSLSSAVPFVIICIDNNEAVNVASAGDPVCGGLSAVWPNLPTDWIYSGFSANPTAGTFNFGASSENDEKTVTCDYKGCVIN